MESLKNRVAIVTGSSRGVGRACALALAQAGCDIVVAAKSTEEKPRLPGTIHTVAKEIEALGRRALAVKTDVRKEEDIDNLVARTVETFGRVDILLNNAGALWWENMLDTPAKRFDLVLDVNARAAFLLSRACLPHLIENGWGHIINMSPPVDVAVTPGKIAYFISKFGMTLIAHGLAGEVRDQNVACNALWPATLIESQATKNWGLGGPSSWRKADILADSVVAICQKTPSDFTGQALIDEDFLRAEGVTDFARYNCVEGGEPMRIHGAGAALPGAEPAAPRDLAMRTAATEPELKAANKPLPPDHWRCPSCGEAVADTFDACWSCGTSVDGTPDPNFERKPQVLGESPLEPILHIPGLDEIGSESSEDLKPVVEDPPE